MDKAHLPDKTVRRYSTLFSILLAVPSIIFGIMPKPFYGFLQEPETTQAPKPGLSAFLQWFCWRPPVGILQPTYTVLCQLVQGGLACCGFYLILHFDIKEQRDSEDRMTDNCVFLMNFGMAALLSIFNNVIWAFNIVSYRLLLLWHFFTYVFSWIHFKEENIDFSGRKENLCAPVNLLIIVKPCQWE
jgi:hypothetical protein